MSTGIAISRLDTDDMQRVIATALEEDLRYGPDATTAACVPPGAVATATVSPRSPGTLAGLPVFLAVLDTVLGAGGYEASTRRRDGERIAGGDTVVAIRGPVAGLLTAERSALNLLCHLSGIATVTAAWVDAVAGTGASIRDSRKTLPGLRRLQKYAVRCGGGVNHRMGLGDAVLIKDNHVAAAGSVTAAIAAVRAAVPQLPCEVEVGTLDELDEALAAGASLVLLDNMTVAQCAEAARRAANSATELEASGGLTLDVARAYAETGVHYLAVGALTHSAPALDFGLDLE
ncbi:MAG TPA: carboxylating nicotinate-nucleotide diphosphorylase [Pseudonocardiaceae bacterium]|jgi:nicotinate-nucleotide pyrophosphorylase (carboxylating)|nr:carboxylating nicotinate-nucleotide diphosphorylase [Pseudonocardiaceae bacterium]